MRARANLHRHTRHTNSSPTSGRALWGGKRVWGAAAAAAVACTGSGAGAAATADGCDVGRLGVAAVVASEFALPLLITTNWETAGGSGDVSTASSLALRDPSAMTGAALLLSPAARSLLVAPKEMVIFAGLAAVKDCCSSCFSSCVFFIQRSSSCPIFLSRMVLAFRFFSFLAAFSASLSVVMVCVCVC